MPKKTGPGPMLLPMGDVGDVPREARLKQWMRSKGLYLDDLATRWGCHFSFPGKCLFPGKDGRLAEKLPEEKRADLVDELGCPPDLLP